ncbi:MAG: DUF1573 domain-containing protein [Tidjanibacter sp.]|nr:DUF1573 domain-containing protein [Tidjanibacter sp.]
MTCTHKYKVLRRCYPVLVVAFAVLLMGCGGRPSRKAQGVSPDLLQAISLSDSLRVDTIDFGKVRAGEVVERSFALVNEGEAPVVVVTTDTSCGCLELDYSKEPIRSGKKSVARLTFYSSGYTYFVPRAFYIVSTASLAPKKLVVVAEME